MIDRAVELSIAAGEALSNPYAAWAQTNAYLEGYGDPINISAHTHEFEDSRAGEIDVHTLDDLLKTYRLKQGTRPVGLPEGFQSESTQEEGFESR